ncbi:MAG: SDR family oxidoreductase, partial [Myxococcota bacterium]|nr:SDR family oxidoreductase [Myxococcota bacterium]
MWHGHRRLRDQVVVIVGASSGIGLATARLAARRGAAVVLASRHEGALRAIALELRAQGGRASHVVADVTEPAQVRAIADAAIDEHGAFDTWINVASTGTYGEVLEVSLEDHRRVFEVSFWGLVHGSRLAVEHFRSPERRGAREGGTLINIGSVLSDRAFPLLGPYSASKHAVKAFTNALRMELEKKGAPVAVTLIQPPSTDTPFPLRARNYLDREVKLPSPIYEPQVVARAILSCAERPRRNVVVGGIGGVSLVWLEKIAPRLLDVGLRYLTRPLLTKREPARPGRDDALYTPSVHDGEERGPDRRFALRSSLYTALRLH